MLEALKAGRKIKNVNLAKGSKGAVIDEIISLCRRRDIQVTSLDKGRLEDIASTQGHQGVIAVAKPIERVSLGELLDNTDLSKQPMILVLDHLHDPQNFGAILRTAETAGVMAVVIPNRRSVGITPAVLKVAAGAAEYIPVAEVTNLARTLEQLKEKGFWVIGADAAAEASVYQTDLAMPLALVIGSEGKGLSRLVQERCDLLVSIPLKGRLNSLNASTAAAVVVFEALRQRLKDR